jgi:hypothetical protein
LARLKALFVSTLPRLKDGGHERYEVFRRTAASLSALRYGMLSHVSGKPSEIQKVFHEAIRFYRRQYTWIGTNGYRRRFLSDLKCGVKDGNDPI